MSLMTDEFLPALLVTMPKDGRAQKFKYCQQFVMLKVSLRRELHAVTLPAGTGEKLLSGDTDRPKNPTCHND